MIAWPTSSTSRLLWISRAGRPVALATDESDTTSSPRTFRSGRRRGSDAWIPQYDGTPLPLWTSQTSQTR